MIILNMEQGSDEWIAARLAIPTASEFDKIITGIFAASSQQNSYMGKLLAEYITGEHIGFEGNEHTERGHVMEPRARKLYETSRGVSVDQPGIVYKSDSRDRACSPDGLMLDRGLEIKSPKLENHIGYVLDGELPKKYAPQVHGSMYITGLDMWDFVSFHPDYPPLIITVERDDKIDAKISKALDVFCDRLAEEKAKIDGMREF